MAYPHGRAVVRATNPQAFGVCDRCNFLYNHIHLRWQIDYSGAGLYNKRILVCEKCYDTPQQQLKVIVIPPDPLPIINARPQDYVNAEVDYRITYGQNTVDPVTGIPIIQGDNIGDYTQLSNLYSIELETMDGFLAMESDDSILIGQEPTVGIALRVTQQTGESPNGYNEAPGTSFQVPGNDDPGLPYENVNVPLTGPLK